MPGEPQPFLPFAPFGIALLHLPHGLQLGLHLHTSCLLLLPLLIGKVINHTTAIRIMKYFLMIIASVG